MSEVTPEAREVLNDSLGMVAANIIYRTLDGLADVETRPSVGTFGNQMDGAVEEELPKPKDYDKAINTALKVLAFFSFTALDTEFDDETKEKMDKLLERLPNKRKQRKKAADNVNGNTN